MQPESCENQRGESGSDAEDTRQGAVVAAAAAAAVSGNLGLKNEKVFS